MKSSVLKSSLAAVVVLMTAATAAAASPTVDTAKAGCIVGEQYDGYLGVIDAGAASEALKREVRSINLQRKAAYASLAERNGVTVDVAATLTAEKLLIGAPSGQCILPQAGATWQKKP
jgi:uncharacterized protein YdbL (DUF1318 family)